MLTDINRVIFVGQSGNSRAAMASELLKAQPFGRPVEIIARGLVVLMPEPINQKANAVMISNEIKLENFSSSQLLEEDFGQDTLVVTFSSALKEKIAQRFESAQNLHVLTELTGDELEILDPYGGELIAYGLCFESLVKPIKTLAAMLRGEIYYD